MKTEQNKFGVKDQVCYLFGDAGGNFVNMLVDAQFLAFSTYVLKIDPLFMGTMFLLVRIWDAINDPLIGSLPDRYLLGRSGDRFKPYIRLAMFPLVVSGLMAFADVSSWPTAVRYIWVTVAYVLVGMSYTGVSMPYGSMASVITEDQVERSKLSRARAFGGVLVTVILSLVPQFVYDKETLDPIPRNFFFAAVICGVLSILSFTVLLKGSTERIHYDTKAQDYKFSVVLRAALHNRPLIGTMIAAVGFLIFNTGFNQMSTYIFREYYHNTSIITFASVISLPLMLILFPFIPTLTRKYGKVKTIVVPCIFGAVLSLVLIFVPVANPWLYLALEAVAIIGPMLYMLSCWAIVTDCIDYQEYTTGLRADGSIYSMYTFSRKIGSAIASAFASYSLALIGFDETLSLQTTEVAGRIRVLVSCLPFAGCALILIGLGLVYNLSDEDARRINAELRARHESEQAAPEGDGGMSQ